MAIVASVKISIRPSRLMAVYPARRVSRTDLSCSSDVGDGFICVSHSVDIDLYTKVFA